MKKLLEGNETILVLAPHPDDGEFSCGGSLKKWADCGNEIWYIAFSPCNKSLPQGYEKNAIYDELEIAIKHLGISSSRLIKLDFEVREFPRDRQLILEQLIQLRKKINPTVVLVPNSKDIHQDHKQIFLEGCRAFKHASLLGYELIWNNITSPCNFYVKLNKEHLDAKMAALECYKSQKGRIYSDKEFIYGLGKVRGVQIGVDYAEAFELIRWIS